MSTNKRFRKNMLVAYKGGGYDGCMWEWNYAYFDNDRKFHDIYSSGSMGCKTEAEMRVKLREFPDDVELTNLNSERARNKFVDSECVRGVVGCATWFATNGYDITLCPKCDCCGNRVNAVEGHPENYKGVGGVEIHAQEIVCQDCVDSYTCSNCNEFYDPDHNFSETEHLSHACEYCTQQDGGAISHDSEQTGASERHNDCLI